MAAYFSVKRTPTGATVTSANATAKQIFFGWAGGGGAGYEFYGRATGRRGARGDQWCWNLSPSGVTLMTSNIRNHISDENQKN